MTLPNQGYRKDLNLGETPSERKALASLAGAGIDADIDRIVNNLRNTSDISFHTLKCDIFNIYKSCSFIKTCSRSYYFFL